MAILDTLKTLFGIKPDKNKLHEALWKSFYFDGIVTTPVDTPDAYLREGYAGNADVYAIITKIDAMRKRANAKAGENEAIPEIRHGRKRRGNGSRTDKIPEQSQPSYVF